MKRYRRGSRTCPSRSASDLRLLLARSYILRLARSTVSSPPRTMRSVENNRPWLQFISNMVLRSDQDELTMVNKAIKAPGKTSPASLPFGPSSRPCDLIGYRLYPSINPTRYRPRGPPKTIHDPHQSHHSRRLIESLIEKRYTLETCVEKIDRIGLAKMTNSKGVIANNDTNACM